MARRSVVVRRSIFRWSVDHNQKILINCKCKCEAGRRKVEQYKAISKSSLVRSALISGKNRIRQKNFRVRQNVTYHIQNQTIPYLDLLTQTKTHTKLYFPTLPFVSGWHSWEYPLTVFRPLWGPADGRRAPWGRSQEHSGTPALGPSS